MDQELASEIRNMKARMEDIYTSVEKTRKMFFWTLVLSAAVFILPLIGIMFLIPQFISAIGGNLGGF